MLAGALRACVACSNANASLSSVASLHSGPRNSRPTGTPIGAVPVQAIQALYLDNPQGLADYIAKPVKKRDDYPEMPPQDYLDPETRLAVAKYMLQVTN